MNKFSRPKEEIHNSRKAKLISLELNKLIN
jgi:hypothetical protein